MRSNRLMRLSGRRYVSYPYRARIQLRRKGHAYEWYHRRTPGSIRVFWTDLLPSEFGNLIDRLGSVLPPDLVK